MEEHVDLACGVLVGCGSAQRVVERAMWAHLDAAADALDELLLSEGLEAPVDDSLVQLGLDFDMLRPDTWV